MNEYEFPESKVANVQVRAEAGGGGCARGGGRVKTTGLLTNGLSVPIVRHRLHSMQSENEEGAHESFSSHHR